MTDRPTPTTGSTATEPDYWFAQGTLIHAPDRGGIDVGPLIGEAKTEASAASLVRRHNDLVRAAASPSATEPETPHKEKAMTGHALHGVLSDADIALAAALSVAVPTMLAEDAMDKAPGMIEHLRAQGFDVLPRQPWIGEASDG